MCMLVCFSLHLKSYSNAVPPSGLVMLEKLRALVQEYVAKQLYESAQFWADKVLTLSDGDPSDLATYGQVLYNRGHYQRAAHILVSSPHLVRSAALRYLTAKCYAASKQWEQVLSILEPQDEAQDHQGDEQEGSDSVHVPSLGNVESASMLLRGLAHEGLDNIHAAISSYKASLAADVFCEEALEKLRYLHALSAEEERSLMASLPFRKQCVTVEEEQLVRYLYQKKLVHGGTQHVTPAAATKAAADFGAADFGAKDHVTQALAANLDVLCSRAEESFQSFDAATCLDLTSHILSLDPYHESALLLHVASCVQLGRADELFSVGHRLVEQFPASPVSWYAVACYYIVASRHQLVLKYLTKAISLDPHFVPAHMAFGLAFASEGEHDQAIAAYSNAARMMQGSHWPLAYLGKEYFLTGATSISNRFMKNACALAPSDPVLLQEVGVVLYHSREYERAERYLTRAAECLRAVDPHVTLQAWEPVYNNLGHVHRKLGRYELALECHYKALQLKPDEPSTLTAIAFVHLLTGDYDGAVVYCNKSLCLRREDQFTIAVLQEAVEREGEEALDLGGLKVGTMEEEDEGEISSALFGDGGGIEGGSGLNGCDAAVAMTVE